MKKMIKDFFCDENMGDEDIDAVIEEIKKNKITSEDELSRFLSWLKKEFSKRIIDDSEFDEE